MNLNDWSEQWLRTKGPNKITTEVEEEGGKIKSFKIRQGITKFGDNIFRKQTINIGYFDSANAYHVIEKVNIEAQEITDVPQFVGIDTPKAILLNSDDYGFAVFAIDNKSQAFYEQNLPLVPTQLNRVVVIS